MTIQLMLGDCLERMAEIPDGSVDMVLCDLPYWTTACKWDSVIPFDLLWTHYRRIAKPNAAIVLTASQPFTTALIASNMREFRYSLVWEKNKATGHLNANRMPLRAHEDVCVFASATPAYIPVLGVGVAYSNKHTAGDSGDCYGKVAESRRDNVATRFPRSVVRFPVEMRPQHPTQKPVALMEYLIRTYTNEGETVLDNTMGSGTTGVACVNTGRNFIGIERDPGYFAIAQARISNTQQPLLTAAA
jgi:hypothetical protein